MPPPAATILAAGAAILAISLGIRHAFGLFLQPVSMDAGWGREVFALAIATQNLVWGAAQPFVGLLADRFGAGRVVAGGAVLYVVGLALMAVPGASEAGFLLAAGLLVGLGLSGTTFPVVFGAVSRATLPERRSLAMGIAMAVGSFGQFVMLPGAAFGIQGIGWSATLIAFSILAAVMLPLACRCVRAAGTTHRRRNSRRNKPSGWRWPIAVSGCSHSASSSAASRWCSSPRICRLSSPTAAST